MFRTGTPHGIIDRVDVAFYLPGSFPIYTFSLLLGAGASLGLFWIVQEAPEEAARGQVNAGLYALLGALLGGRATYVGINWDYFRTHPLEIPQVWLGGLSWWGAAAAAIIALGLVAALNGQSLGELGDALLPLMTTLSVSVWLGCWVEGCAYGTKVNAWWALPAKDEWGEMFNRLPVQLFGAILTLVVFWVLERLRGRTWFRVPGRAASLGFGGISLILLGLSSLRVDPAPLWKGQRVDTWAAIGFTVLAGLSLLATLRGQAQPEED